MPDRQSLPKPVALYLDVTTALVKLPFRVALLPFRVAARGVHAAPLVRAGVGALAGGLRRGGEDVASAREVVDTAPPAGTDETEVPAEEQPKGAPTPTRREANEARVRTDVPHLQSVPAPEAPDSVVEVVNPRTVAAEVLEASPSDTASNLDHGELPLPDYDHLTLGSLRSQLRSLDAEQLAQLRDYERAHANRLPVLLLFENRIAKLPAAATSAAPSSSG